MATENTPPSESQVSAPGGQARFHPGRMALAGLTILLFAGAASAADSDGDGIDDATDTCHLLANAHQGDADGDGFGDPCDCDFDGNGFCSIDDFSTFLGDFVAGTDTGSGTDMSGDGFVNIDDFSLFVRGFLTGTPGPGATGSSDVAALYSGVECDGPDPAAACDILLAPGLVLEAVRGQLASVADGLEVSGTVRIPTTTGDLTLLEVSLIIAPGPGPFGFDTVRGTGVLSNNLGGWFGDFAIDLLTVDVGFDLGANIAADIPLKDELHYLLFHAAGGINLDIGDFTVEGPSAGMTLLFNPGDPFLYVGAEVTNIPLPLPAGGFTLLSGGLGSGYSAQGLIPFEPATTAGIAALFPNFEGHMIQRMEGSLPSCPGCPALAVEGYAVTDLDPLEDGMALFGEDPDDDYRVGINGTFGIEGTIGLLTLQVDLFDATGGWSSIDGQLAMFAGGRVDYRPGLFDLDAPQLFDLAPDVGEEIGLGVMFGPNLADDFFRFESRRISVGTDAVSNAVGVGVSGFLSEEYFFQIGGAGTFLGGRTTAQAVVDGLTALDESSFELSFPHVGEPELTMYSRYQIGEAQLRESTVWISPVRIAQEGLYDMPNYTFRMLGEITAAGPRLEGSLEVPIPYHYPALELVLDVANRIDQRQGEIATLQQLAGQQLGAVGSAQTAVDVQQDVLTAVQAVLTAARNDLDDHDDAIADAENRDCGCDCGTLDAFCWTACGLCVTAREAEVLYLKGRRGLFVTAVDLARTGVLLAQDKLGDLELALTLTEDALSLTQSSLDDAIGALAALYQERDSLPAEDGVFDATVTLVLTEHDVTGSIGGDFQGAAVGDSIVYTGENPRACFVPPAPGASEEFCTPL